MPSTAELIFRIRPQGGEDFKSVMAQVRSELTQTGQSQAATTKSELSQQQQLAAAASLQRQRSAALIAEWKKTERAASDLAHGVAPVKDNLQKVTDVMQTLGASSAVLTGPLGGVAGRLRSVGTIANEMGDSLGVAGVAMGASAVAAIGLTVAAVGLAAAFYNLVTATAEFQGNLFDLSQQTGISVETLSALEIVAKTTGSSLEQITASLGIFQKNLEAAHDPTSKQAELLENLGISATNTEDALRQSLKALSAMPEGYRQTAIALELFGRGGKSVLAILKETNGDLDGAIKRFREMGILVSGDVAKAADKFNDQLALLGFQTRAISALLVQDSIPKILVILEEFSRTLNNNQDAIRALGKAVTFLVEIQLSGLKVGLQVVTDIVHDLELAWDGVRAASLFAMGDIVKAAQVTAEAIEKSKRFAQGTQPTAEQPATTTPASLRFLVPTIATQEAQLAGLKQLATEMARISQDQIAQAKDDFQKGQITREQEKNAIIQGLRVRKDADLAAIAAERSKQERLRATQEGLLSDQRKTDQEIAKLDQQARNIKSEFNRAVAEEETKAEQDRAKALIEQSNRTVSIRQKQAENEIAIIENKIKANEIAEEVGAKRIADIQNRVLAERAKALNLQLGVAVVGGLSQAERDQIIQQRKELNLEVAATEQQQAERLREIHRKQAENDRSLQLQQIDDQLRLGKVRDDNQIASLRELAALRIKTEEETEQAILKIRLDAIDREAEAVRSRLAAAESITDPKARKAEEEKLNADLKVLQAEREGIQAEGDRNIEAGRQKDVENRRRYAEEIRAVDEDIRRNDLEQRRHDLEQLAQHQGLNAQTIALFRQLTLDEETEHHKRVLGEIDAQEAQAHAVDVGGKNRLEIEQRYNKLREQENDRFKKRNDEINKPGGADVSGQAPKSAIEQLFGAVNENLSGAKQTAAIAGLEALTSAFQGLGQAIGQVVQAWVLYGNAGTSIRKVTAEILAGIAQQAAIKAVFELAEGFAALALAFFGLPNAGPSAGAHFAAAAIYASIAGVAAIAGRAVAGNSFQQKPETGASPSSQSNAARPSPPQVKDVNRRTGSGVNVVIHLHGDIATDALHVRVVDAVVDGVSRNDKRLTATIQDTAKRAA